MNITLNSKESAFLARITSDGTKEITDIEKTESQFRVHYRQFGGSGSEAMIYSLGGSVSEAVAKIRDLKKINK